MALGTVILTVEVRDHDAVITVDCVGMTSVTVYRLGYGGSVIVRGMDHVDTPAPDHFFGVDAEIPNGLVGYRAVASDGTITAQSSQFNASMDHGGDWFMPLGMIEQGRLVNVESLKQHTYTAAREVVQVLGRQDPVAVHFGRYWFTGSLILLTLNDDERQWLELVLFDSRVIVFCPRQGAGYEQTLYLSIGEVACERTSAYALEQSRRWTMEVQSIGAPPANYNVAPIGDSWGDVADEGFTWEERALTDTWRTLTGV